MCDRLEALFTSATWVNAWGKLPSWRPRLRVILLGEESHVVGEAEQSLEEGACFVDASHHRKVVHEPECARQEDTFTGG